MNDLWFWRRWAAPYRYTHLTLLSISLATLLGFFICYAFNIIPSIGWDVLSKAEWLSTPLSILKPDLYSSGINLEYLLVQQLFRGQPLHISAWWGHALLALIAIVVSVAQGIVTTLPRLWYIIGTTIMVFFIYFFQLDLLLIPIFDNRGGIILTLALYLPLGYYLHAIRPQTNLIARIGLFLLATGILAGLFGALSETPEPFFFLSQYAILLPIGLIAVFIITVAHEPVANLVYLSSQSGSRQAVFHYIVFIAIYLAYLFISYLHLTKSIDWDIYYLDGYLLLGISSVLGIWGFQRREDFAKHILPFNPAGAWLYLLMMMTTWGSLLYFWVTANDAYMETIEEVIFMTHMGFGIVFFLYTISNFYSPMRMGKPVHKVLYKPHRMPFYVFRFMGLIATIAAGYQSSNYPITRTTAAYFNGIGDAYAVQNNPTYAQAYYFRGMQFSNANHRSNYALASLAINNQETEVAIKHLLRGTYKNTIPQTWVNLGLMLKDEQRFFQAKFQLEDGLSRHPNNGPIANNLGLMYYDTDFLDSAFTYFDIASESNSSASAGRINEWAVLAKLNVPLPSDSVEQLLYHDEIGLDANILAWLGQSPTPVSLPKPPTPQDSALSQNELARIYNYALSQLHRPDTSWMNQMHGYLRHPQNGSWFERITLAKALTDYQAMNYYDAYQGFSRLANNIPRRAGVYLSMQGIMAEKIGLPERATTVFQRAAEEKYSPAQYFLGFAYMESGYLEEAKSYWESLVKTLDSTQPAHQLAQQAISALNWQAGNSATSLNDDQKLWIITFRNQELPQSTLVNLWQSIQSAEQKALAGIRLVMAGPNLKAAIAPALSQLSVPTPELAQRIAWALVATDPTTTASQMLNLNAVTPNQQITKKLLEWETQNPETKVEPITRLALQAPFRSDLIAEATDALNQTGDTLRGYTVAQRALLFNPWNTEIAKIYVFQSLYSKYTALAEDTLEELSLALPEEEYNSLLRQYEEQKLDIMPKNF